MTLHLLADAAASAPDWRTWLTPETLISVLSTIAAVLGFLGRAKYKRIAVAIIAGVESYRRAEETPREQAADVALAIQQTATRAGVEPVLGPLVDAVTRPHR